MDCDPGLLVISSTGDINFAKISNELDSWDSCPLGFVSQFISGTGSQTLEIEH